MWQAAWLHHHHHQQQPHTHADHPPPSSSTLAEAASVHALRQHFPSFVQEAKSLGYKVDQVSVQTGGVRVRVGQQ